MDRFFCPDLVDQLGDLIEFPDDEAHHASRVLRKTAGDKVQLFDGRGQSVDALLVDVRKKGVTAELAGSVVADPPRAKQLILAAAAPKADRFKWLVEKTTELGVDRLIPLECERSVVHPGGSKLDKLRATVVAACKQSGRNKLMEIDAPTSFDDVLQIGADRRIIADVPRGDTATAIADAETTLAIVGPEGGWSGGEHSAAIAAGFAPLQIGGNVLRTETAAIAVAARLVS